MAKRRPTGGLHPNTAHFMERASDESLRRQGRFRDLVLRLLAPDEELRAEANGIWETRVVRTRRRREPTREELVAAYEESPAPLPAPIVDYIVQHYVKQLPLKTGPKTTTRTTYQDVTIIAFYQHQLRKARLRQAAGVTASPVARAKARTAQKFGISISTLNGILAPRAL